MTAKVPNKNWSKPTIKRLGTLKDVAGAQTPVAQATTTKS